MRLNDLAGRQVVVWGAGVDTTETAKAAERIGAQVSFALDDQQDGPEEREGMRVYYGDEAAEVLRHADVVIKSPAIPPHHPLYIALEQQGTAITSTADLWLQDHRQKTIAITGSKGKSTASSLLAHLLSACGYDVALGGNIGLSLYALPDDADWYVVEWSSYQCASLTASPHAAMLTSLFPEHIPWHGSVDAYYDAKLNLVRYNPDIVVANSESQELQRRLDALEIDHVTWTPSEHVAVDKMGNIIVDGQIYFTAADSPLFGRHNQVNLALCLAMLEALGIDVTQKKQEILQAIAHFHPLEHRLELVPSKDKLMWINDSLASNPNAAAAALEVFADRPVTLLVGGQDRGFSYQPLYDQLAARTTQATVITMPSNGQHIAEGMVPDQKVIAADSLEDAVKRARQVTPEGGVVVFSPAAPSFDKFKNYADRGEQFKKAVQNL